MIANLLIIISKKIWALISKKTMSINFPRYIITFLILISSEGSYEIFQMRNGVSQESGNMIYSMNKN